MGVNFRIALFFLTGLIFFKSYAQKSTSIVDDTTKVIYGSNTSKIFTVETLYKENRVFFNKDTLLARPFTQLVPNFKLDYERPQLYAPSELKAKLLADSLAKFRKDSTEKAELTISDTTSYYKKDSLYDPYFRFLSFFKKKPLKELPYSSRFFKNEYSYTKSDTSIDRIQQYNMNYGEDNIYQNLGLIGTPSKAVFLKQPETLGYQSGFNVYNLYYTDPSKVKYYNSKSPYTNVYYVGMPGTTGEDRIKLDINRNITRSWNLGFSYERIYADKQIGQSGTSSRGLALGQEFIFYTSTKSRDGRYHFMGNLNYFLYNTNEQGGLVKLNNINAGSEETQLSPSRLPNNVGGWPVQLNALSFSVNGATTANRIFSRDRRVSYFMYHQYDILKLGRLSAFYEFDRRNQRYTFGDPVTRLSSNIDSNFYKGGNRHAEGKAYFNYEFAYITNKIGLKSNWGKFAIGFYYKNRYVTGSKQLSIVSGFDFFSSPGREIGKWLADPKAEIRLYESYFGGFAKYKLSDSISFEFAGEMMASLINKSKPDSVYEAAVNASPNTMDTSKVYLPNQYRNYDYKGDYNFNFKANLYNVEFGLNLLRNSPSIINYYSLQHNLYYWNQPLRASTSNNLYAKFHLESKKVYFSLQPSVFQLQNYTYFNSEVMPMQTDKDKQLYYGFLDLTFNASLWLIHFDTQVKYTYIPNNQPDVIRMPAYYVNPRIYIKYVPKSKINKQDFRFGFDIYYRSNYYGDTYMPSVGQFLVQDLQNSSNLYSLNNNTLVDFFITAKLRNARIFLKINQLNQLVGLSKGYYISPYYPAINGGFQFGLHWLLFN